MADRRRNVVEFDSVAAGSYMARCRSAALLPLLCLVGVSDYPAPYMPSMVME